MPQNIQKIAGRKGNTLNIARVAYFQAFISRTHVLALGGKLHFRGAQVHVGAAVAFRIKNEDAAQGLHELFAIQAHGPHAFVRKAAKKNIVVRILVTGPGQTQRFIAVDRAQIKAFVREVQLNFVHAQPFFDVL